MLSKKLWINLLCEFSPIVVFLFTFEMGGFRVATLSMIVAVVIAFFALRISEGHTPYFALLNTASVIVFGGVSAFVDIPDIFIVRDSIFDFVLGTALLASLWSKTPGLKLLFNNVFAISDKGWVIFTKRWGIFFLLLGVLNEIVRNFFTPDTWVSFKVGMIIVTVCFGFYQLTLTSKERLSEADTLGLRA